MYSSLPSSKDRHEFNSLQGKHSSNSLSLSTNRQTCNETKDEKGRKRGKDTMAQAVKQGHRYHSPSLLISGRQGEFSLFPSILSLAFPRMGEHGHSSLLSSTALIALPSAKTGTTMVARRTSGILLACLNPNDTVN